MVHLAGNEPAASIMLRWVTMSVACHKEGLETCKMGLETCKKSLETCKKDLETGKAGLETWHVVVCKILLS